MATTLAQAQRAMSLYGLSTFYIFGTIGNFLLICILIQRTHRRNSCALYLLAATIVNFILLQCILPLAIYSADHVDPQNVTLAWCKIRSYLFNSLLMQYRWHKMAACVDRAAMCSRRVWIRSLSDARIASRAIFIITIVWLLIPLHLAVYFRIESGRCVPESSAYAKFFSAYSIVVSGWSPPIVMAIFGAIAYQNLKKIRARVTRLNNPAGIIHNQSNNMNGREWESRRVGNRDRELIVLLISEVIVYICTNLLYSVNIAYSAFTSGQSKNMERLSAEAFVSYFSTPFLIIINNCAPFYLYLIVSSKFRQDVKKLFTCCCYSPQIIPERSNRLPVIAQRPVTENRGNLETIS